MLLLKRRIQNSFVICRASSFCNHSSTRVFARCCCWCLHKLILHDLQVLRKNVLLVWHERMISQRLLRISYLNLSYFEKKAFYMWDFYHTSASYKSRSSRQVLTEKGFLVLSSLDSIKCMVSLAASFLGKQNSQMSNTVKYTQNFSKELAVVHLKATFNASGVTEASVCVHDHRSLFFLPLMFLLFFQKNLVTPSLSWVFYSAL